MEWKKRSLIVLFLLSAGFSCDLLESDSGGGDPDIAEGLKAALRVGTDTAVSRLAAVDGYLKDEAVKILLPDEMEAQIANFKAINVNVFGLASFTGEEIYNAGIPALGIVGLAGLEDQLITGINRAAESAATEALSLIHI